MGYFVQASRLLLLGILSLGIVVGRSNVAIGQSNSLPVAPTETKTNGAEQLQIDLAKIVEVDQLIEQGQQQLDSSQYEAAQQSYTQALRIYREIKFPSGEAFVLMNLGITYRAMSQYDKAIIFYKQSINVHELIRYGGRTLSEEGQKAFAQSISDTYIDLAKLLKEQGRLTEAQAVLALLDRVPPNNADGIPLTPTEQKILAEFSKKLP